jgi:Tfp pilus assembly major pilin PilA
MDKNQIIIIAAVLVAVGLRLYKNYAKKNNAKTGTDTKKSSISFPSDSNDDGYEPYSKK